MTPRKTPLQAFGFHLRNLGIFLLLLAPVFTYILANNAYTNSLVARNGPYVHFNGLDPSSEAYVTWETPDPEATSLSLGTTPGALAPHVTNATPVTLHRVKLQGLTPDTVYHYQASNGRTGSFKTAPLVTRDFSIGLFSDSQQLWGIGHYEVISSLIAADRDIAFVSCVGDIAQEPDVQPYWNLFWQQSEPWFPRVPFVPVIGNHDIDYANATGSRYYKYFGFSYDNGPYNNTFYYTFNWSHVQFVIAEISTTGTITGNGDIDITLHDTWLNETLANGQDKAFRIVMFHRNLMTSTTTDQRLVDRITPIAERYNVSLVIFGHNHHYERLLYNDVRYLCLGGGGGMQDGAFRIIPECEALNVGPSYTRLTFSADRIHGNTISERGDAIDTFTLVKDGSRVVLLGGGA